MDVYHAVSDWKLADLQAFQEHLNDAIESAEEETCPDCGNRPNTGACFYCKMD